MTDLNNPVISIVVPAYNEKENLEKLISTLKDVFRDIHYEVIIVDDGSRDGTYEEAIRLRDLYAINLKAIRHEKNMGKPAALLTGFKNAEGTYTAVLDADMQFHPKDIYQMLQVALSENAEVVAGRRVDTRPPSRRVVSVGAKILAKILIPETRKLQDPITEVYVVKTDILKKCDIKPQIKPFLQILVKCSPKAVAEVPVQIYPRLHGKSKFKIKWITNYLTEIMDLTHYYPLRYIAGALVALPVSLALWPHLGLAAPILAALVKWAFIWRDVGPATTIGAKALALALKLTEAATWYVTAPLEFLVLTALRKRSPI